MNYLRIWWTLKSQKNLLKIKSNNLKLIFKTRNLKNHAKYFNKIIKIIIIYLKFKKMLIKNKMISTIIKKVNKH